MPLRKWDKLHMATHNDIMIITAGVSYQTYISADYGTLLRIFGQSCDEKISYGQFTNWRFLVNSSPESALVVKPNKTEMSNTKDIWDIRFWQVFGYHMRYAKHLVSKVEQYKNKYGGR